MTFPAVVAAEGKDTGRTLLDAGGIMYAFRVLHRQTLLAKFMTKIPTWQTEVQTFRKCIYVCRGKCGNEKSGCGCALGPRGGRRSGTRRGR